ncbi:MAG TPA: FG-GAP-like repeat-containing protein, partial [Polyangia bacterium]|nr:FG-GAP-like repeat-containing protein [Polyangia bacterium]
RFLDETDASLGDEIAIWALDRVVDAWGNYYDVLYNQDPSGVEQADFEARGLIATSIKYTGHFDGGKISPSDGAFTSVAATTPFTTVSFTYEVRPDIRRTRFRRATLPRKQRLRAITTDAGTYVLDYLPATDVMLPSRLSSINYCATPAFVPPPPALPTVQCLKPLVFDWQGGGYSWAPADNYALPAPIDQNFAADPPVTTRGTQFVDLDGDGRVDLVHSAAFDPPFETWRNTGSGWDSQASWRLPSERGGTIILADENNNPAKTLFADMDGDGVLDIIGSRYSCIENHTIFGTDRHCQQFPTEVWLNRIKQGGGWVLGTEFNNGPMAPLAANGSMDLGFKDTVADLNHDGRADLIRIGPGSHDVNLFLNTPNGWSGPFSIGSDAQGLNVGFVGDVKAYHWEDVNRDGFPDIVGNLGTDGAGKYFMFLGLANGTGKIWGAFQDDLPREFTQPTRVQIADIDGDGRHDRLMAFQFFVDGDGINAGIYHGVALATGVGYDFSEIIGSATTNDETFINNSAVATPYLTASKAELNNAFAQFRDERIDFFNMPDLNGDGLADLVMGMQTFPKSGPTNFAINNGFFWNFPTSSTPDQDLPIIPAAVNGGAFVDLDGDGLLDIVRSVSGGETHAWLNTFQRPMIKHFPNGMARPNEVTYAIITKADVQAQGIYTDTAPRDPGTQYLALPMTVVASVATDDGLGSAAMPTTHYQYSSLRNSASGRGPQGFHQVTVIEPGNASTIGTTTVTTLAQAYPYTGLPTSVTRSKGTTLVTSTATQYCDAIDKNACAPITGKIYGPKASVYVYPATVIDATVQFEGERPAGTLTVRTDFTYDGLGNPTVVAVKTTNDATGETNQTTTTNVYDATVSADMPRLGKVTRTTVDSQRLAPSDGNNARVVHVTEFDYSLPGNFRMPMQSEARLTSTLGLLRTRVEPSTITTNVAPGMTDYVAQHTAYEHDEFGHVVTTTVCASDFPSCAPGAVNPVADPNDPA